MKKIYNISLTILVSGITLYASHDTLKIKNKTQQPIEITVHEKTPTGGGSRRKNVQAGAIVNFSVNTPSIDTISWQTPSAKNSTCIDSYKLDKKSPIIRSLNKHGGNSMLSIEEKGGYQTVIGTIDRAIMRTFKEKCYKLLPEKWTE